MRTYTCTCGSPLFFDNSLCLTCASQLGFCPQCRNIVALLPGKEHRFICGNPKCGAQLVQCANYAEHDVCNRMVLAEGASDKPLCDCCRFNATIPDLTVPGHLQKWYRLEAAKRRLFYDLDRVSLPYGTAADGVLPPLSFDFKADVIPKADFWRSMAKAERVYTGHADGHITINIREADDVEREKLRVDMAEAHRTLIGHFRHEIGHYYWDMLVKDRREEESIAHFGDHNHPPYAEALELHYTNGPPADWPERHVSAYASMHPWEDFAETWAIYLDMRSALDTAEHVGFVETPAVSPEVVDPMIARYQELGVALNEINRSLGLIDVVPEVIVAPVIEKMRFVHDLVCEAGATGAPTRPIATPVSAAPTSQAPTSPAPTSPAPTSPAPTSPAPTSPAPEKPAPKSAAAIKPPAP